METKWAAKAKRAAVQKEWDDEVEIEYDREETDFVVRDFITYAPREIRRQFELYAE